MTPGVATQGPGCVAVALLRFDDRLISHFLESEEIQEPGHVVFERMEQLG